MHLLDLPSELRNEIDTMVFEHTDDETHMLPIPSHYKPSTILSRRYFAILSTNRQIRSEALPFFYTQVIFEAKGEKAAAEWLPTLMDHQIRSIRQMQRRDEQSRSRHSSAAGESGSDAARRGSCEGRTTLGRGN
ncbi:hypothetical protein LTR86_001499 [Recurvomyces mirabilis]|nr:hypothetical protein LTR86_001499 [Recurvomyces mirabilis]